MTLESIDILKYKLYIGLIRNFDSLFVQALFKW